MTRSTFLGFISLVVVGGTFNAVAVFGAVPAPSVFIETVPVGNPGNAPDSTGYGAVSNYFRMGLTEVTNTQYLAFLNAKAKSDPYGLFASEMTASPKGGIIRSGSPGSYSYSIKPPTPGEGLEGADYPYNNKPVVFVSWYDTLRFANWLHNGRGNGSTETGAYTLGALDSNGIPLAGREIVRNEGAKWFLPSENEWYKAAYHKNDGVTGNYWNYPTQSDVLPNKNLPSADTGNSAFYWNGNFPIYNLNYPMIDVGSYPLTSGPYGTLDQAGSVWEWTEALYNPPIYRVLRGGSWAHDISDSLGVLTRKFAGPGGSGFDSNGFRVAAIPEPSAIWLLSISLAAVLLRFACRRRA